MCYGSFDYLGIDSLSELRWCNFVSNVNIAYLGGRSMVSIDNDKGGITGFYMLRKVLP